MIVITSNQNNCDHVFSFTSQDGVHIFKCESCPVEILITNENRTVGSWAIELP